MNIRCYHYCMKDEISLKAKWWLPSTKGDHMVFGEFHYEPNGKLLVITEESLYGTTNLHESVHNITEPIIYGFGKDKECITLFDVKVWEAGRTGWITMELYPEYVFISEHTHFAVIGMEVTNFNFCMNGFGAFFRGYKNRLIPDHKTEERISFHYTQPAPIEIIDDEDKNIYFYFHHRYSGMNEIATGAFEFKERVYLNVSWKQPETFDNFIQQLKFYSDFFRFFSQEILSLDHVNVFLKAEDIEKTGFKFIFKQPTQKYVGVMPSVFHTLLNYNEAAEDLPMLLGNWIKQRDYIVGGLALYMQTKYVSFPSPAQLFLNIVFAIETFHKTFFGNGRKLYLSQRLDELILQNQSMMDRYTFDVRWFTEKVNKQRNYLAHDHSAEDRSFILPEEYTGVNLLLQMIFESSFLRMIGVNEELLEKIMKRNERLETSENWGGAWLRKK